MTRSAPAPDTSPRRRWALVPLGIVVVLVGAVSGVAATLLHGHWWGLALAWAAAGSVLWALPRRLWGRPAFVLGWVAALSGGLVPRAEGDFLIASTWQGYLFLVSVIVFVPCAVHALVSSSGPPQPRERSGLDRAS